MARDRRWYARGWSFRPTHHAPHGWGRLGAFVDGVYAIAATLLVIELRPPEAEPGELGHALAHLGPEYWAYAIGFLQMIAGWLQTRRLDAWMRGIDHYASLLVLFSVGLYALTPFSTAVLARALGSNDDLGTAVRLSAGLLFVALLVFVVLLRYARSSGLLRDDVDPDAQRLYLRNSMVGAAGPGAGLRAVLRLPLGRAGAPGRAQRAGAASAGVPPAARRRRPRTDVHRP